MLTGDTETDREPPAGLGARRAYSTAPEKGTVGNRKENRRASTRAMIFFGYANSRANTPRNIDYRFTTVLGRGSSGCAGKPGRACALSGTAHNRCMIVTVNDNNNL